MYGPNTVYIIGDAKSQQNNPIQQRFGRFMLGLVVDRETGVILNCGSSVMMKSTYDFIDSLFAGRNILNDGDIIRQEVEKRYFGASQKAIIFAFKDAQRRFRLYRQGVLGDRLIRQEDYQGRGLTGEGISGNL